MLLAALVDAGAQLERLQASVNAVIPGAVQLNVAQVTRAGMRATRVDVAVLVEDPPHRTWTTIRELLQGARVPERVRADALAVFARLAEAEAVSYTHLRAHETRHDLVCRLL